MTRVVTTTCRYKRPPKKRKPGPAIEQRIVAAKKGRRFEKTSGGQRFTPQGGSTQPSTDSSRVPSPANDDGPRKSAIVTARKPRLWRSDVPDMTPEEHRRRGDAADALFH